MNTKLLMMTFLFTYTTSTLLAAETKPDAFAPTPWHLVDLWWDIGKDAPFESYSIDVTIGDDVPADVSLYISPIGLGHLNKTAFYGGIQTRADAGTKRDPQIREIGRGLLMSMWGERSLDAIRTSVGGFCQSSGHEGDFVSVRCRYEWKKGAYTYRIVRMDKEVIDGKSFTWVGAFVDSRENDETIFIGALRFPGENLVLSHDLASFIEIYGLRRPVSDIPKLTVTFGNLKVNGQPVEKPTARAIYPKGVPDYADAAGEERSVVVRVGEPVENRTAREAELIKKD